MKPTRTKNKLEEQVEFTGVTGFRKSLLTIIPRLQKNQFLRFVITRHGKPAAVVLSYESYELLLKMAQELADQDENKSREQRLNEAHARMTKDHSARKSVNAPAVFEAAETVNAEQAETATAITAIGTADSWPASIFPAEVEIEDADAQLATEEAAPIAESLLTDVVYSRLADEVVDRILKDPRLKQTRIASRQK